MKLFTMKNYSFVIIVAISLASSIIKAVDQADKKTKVEENQDAGPLVLVSGSKDLVSQVDLPAEMPEATPKTVRKYLKSLGGLKSGDLDEIDDKVLMAIFNAGREFTMNSQVILQIREITKKIAEIQSSIDQNKGASAVLIKNLESLKGLFIHYLVLINKDIGLLKGENTVFKDQINKLYLITFQFHKELGKVVGTIEQNQSIFEEHRQRFAGLDSRFDRNDERLKKLEDGSSIFNLFGNLGLKNSKWVTESLSDLAWNIEKMSYFGYPVMAAANKVLCKIPLINSLSGTLEVPLKAMFTICALCRFYQFFNAAQKHIDLGDNKARNSVIGAGTLLLMLKLKKVI